MDKFYVENVISNVQLIGVLGKFNSFPNTLVLDKIKLAMLFIPYFVRQDLHQNSHFIFFYFNLF